MFNSIKISKLLEKTSEQLEGATEYLKEAMCTDNGDIFKVALTNAFAIFEDWSSYYKRYTELIDDEKEQSELLVIENSNLKKQLNDKDKQINQLQSLVDNLNSIIKSYHENDDTRIELAETRDVLQIALNTINENAKVITTATHMKNRHIGSGNEHPAYRQDVDSKALIDDYNSGKFNLKELAEKYDMTSPGLRDRLIKLGVYKSVYKSHK